MLGQRSTGNRAGLEGRWGWGDGESRDRKARQEPSPRVKAVGSAFRGCGCRQGAGSRTQSHVGRREGDCWGLWGTQAGGRGLGFSQPPL